MQLFDVYSILDINPVKGKGAWVYDAHGNSYLDFYGGHAVISIGHSHPHYVKKLQAQVETLSFYSNSVQNDLQHQLADKLGESSGCNSYQLFLCNSGAEANENALKLASFQTGKSKVIAFKKGFHGRTSAAVAITDNDAIKAPLNKHHQVYILPVNDLKLVEETLAQGDVCAVIIECIQGVGGLDEVPSGFIKKLAQLCKQYQALLIADEVQSGFGRSGKFFAFQHHGITPDLITMAKGMGNGFPVGGVLISDTISPVKGMLGTTFGGNHLACAACLSVLQVIEEENLLNNAMEMERYFRKNCPDLPGLKKIKGRGLMLGLEFNNPIANFRKTLAQEHGVLTGNSKDPNVLRILPPLNISESEIDHFFEKLQKVVK